MPDPIDALYRILSQNKDIDDIGEDKFREGFTAGGDEGVQNRMELHEYMKSLGYDVPDKYEDFVQYYDTVPRNQQQPDLDTQQPGDVSQPGQPQQPMQPGEGI